MTISIMGAGVSMLNRTQIWQQDRKKTKLRQILETWWTEARMTNVVNYWCRDEFMHEFIVCTNDILNKLMRMDIQMTEIVYTFSTENATKKKRSKMKRNIYIVIGH